EALTVTGAELIRLHHKPLHGEQLGVDAQDGGHQKRRLAASKRRKYVDADLAGAEERPTAAVTDRDAVLEQHVADMRIECAALRRGSRIQRDVNAAPKVVVARPRYVSVGDRIGLTAEHCQ